MNALDAILDGLERELALERELGVRSLECARELLAPVGERPAAAPSPAPAAVRPPSASAPAAPVSAAGRSAPGCAVVFLHDRALRPDEIAMMARIVTALGLTPETAPVVFAKPVPKAKAYVLLGPAALRKFMPDVHAAYGTWFKSPKGADVLYTRAPAEVLRFATVTPAVEKLKREMWASLKGVLKRIC